MTVDLECDDLVIGAGVLGLAVATECAKQGRSTVLLEQHPQFGQETSSRNSEVIHSGIYYPVNSRKTHYCLSGREKLYAYCAEKNIQHVQTGKFVIASNADETAYLEKLHAHAKNLGVLVERVTGAEVQRREPLIRCSEALYFSRTGIVDSHQLMQSLENDLQHLGGLVGYRHSVMGAQRDSQGFTLEVNSPDGTLLARCQRLFNSAGLGAAAFSNALLKTQRYEHRFCRGRYFTLSSRYEGKFHSLVYPVPQKDGLGVHVTVDCAGNARLGPDVDWIEERSYPALQRFYDCDWDAVLPQFLAAVRKYCPSLEQNALSPGLIGIRPKLFIDGEAKPDFLIENFDGYVHLLGIESPGLTSALAIAPHAASLQA
ncbi:MAG: FAD-dependent oxidoreductase [Bdellovibrionaceae bacterium]|nr:FAD-dependent oxidoreductase [Pseudobdellovibrionaceae bacterium]